MRRFVPPLAAAPLILVAAGALAAQDGPSIDLTIDRVGLNVGDSREVIGLRLNYRDRRLDRVIGPNVTIWTPYEYTGRVAGLALGLPATGARRIDGIAAGVFGVAATESITGLTLAPADAGAGGDIVGIGVAGVGLGSGGDLRAGRSRASAWARPATAAVSGSAASGSAWAGTRGARRSAGSAWGSAGTCAAWARRRSASASAGTCAGSPSPESGSARAE